MTHEWQKDKDIVYDKWTDKNMKILFLKSSSSFLMTQWSIQPTPKSNLSPSRAAPSIIHLSIILCLYALLFLVPFGFQRKDFLVLLLPEDFLVSWLPKKALSSACGFQKKDFIVPCRSQLKWLSSLMFLQCVPSSTHIFSSLTDQWVTSMKELCPQAGEGTENKWFPGLTSQNWLTH